MSYLLDSHVLLWWLVQDPKLSLTHQKVLKDPLSEVYVSAISIAELGLKISLGKLQLPGDLSEQAQAEGFELLSFSARHANALQYLPFHHRDPFDRMLISQAMTDDLVFLTVDHDCKKYDIVTR